MKNGMFLSCSRCGNRREGDWCPIPSAFGYAFGCKCHRCAECGCRKDASRQEYALAGHAHHGSLWHHPRHYHTVHGQLGRRNFHRRSERHHFGWAISALLHMGYRIGRHSLLFQRILLRMRCFHHFVHPQLLFHRTGRIPFSYIFSINYPDTLYPMGIATPIGSLVSVIICVGFYRYYYAKR